MPIPVTIPAGKLSLTDAEQTEAEAFLAILAQVVRSGTTGSSVDTPPTALVPPNAPTDPATGLPQVEYLTLDSPDKQLFFRQLAVAASKVWSPSNIIIPPPAPYLAQTYTSAGVSRGDAVVLSASGTADSGSNGSDAGALIIGLAMADADPGTTVSVLAIGTFYGVLSGATFGTEYFLGPTGQPVLFNTLSQGQRLVRLGIARSPTDLEVRIMDLGLR